MVVINAVPQGVMIPLPIQLILGMIILAKSEPVVEPQPEPTTDVKPVEEIITVPMAYLLKSKLLGLKERIARWRERS
jgi:hypothetical protein